jgi:hypothetical protein
MARSPFTELSLASVGRLLLGASRQLCTRKTTGVAHRPLVLPRRPSNIQPLAGLPCGPISRVARLDRRHRCRGVLGQEHAGRADALRGLDVSLPSALRWLHRRIRAVQAVHDGVSRLAPETAISATSQINSAQGQVLLGLRRSLPLQFLNRLPVPLGFQPSRAGRGPAGGRQHEMGPDGGFAVHYGRVTDVIPALCNTSRSIHSPHPPRPPPKTYSASGAAIAVCKTAPPACTCSGSGASAPIVHDAIPESISAYIRIATQSLSTAGFRP